MRFTAKQLDSFHIDPRQPASWMTCPFCGGTLIIGIRKDTGRWSLAHTAVDDPLNPGQPHAGCVRFVEHMPERVGEFLKLLRAAGAKFRSLTG
jgi:hypothetical protein